MISTAPLAVPISGPTRLLFGAAGFASSIIEGVGS